MSEILKLSRKVVLRDEMNAKIEEYKKARLEYALEICPFKDGEEITICGYSHNGKKGIVEKIIGTDSGKYSGHWKVIGSVLKKDGSVGMHYFDFTQSDYETSLKKKATK